LSISGELEDVIRVCNPCTDLLREKKKSQYQRKNSIFITTEGKTFLFKELTRPLTFAGGLFFMFKKTQYQSQHFNKDKV